LALGETSKAVYRMALGETSKAVYRMALGETSKAKRFKAWHKEKLAEQNPCLAMIDQYLSALPLSYHHKLWVWPKPVFSSSISWCQAGTRFQPLISGSGSVLLTTTSNGFRLNFLKPFSLGTKEWWI
jgi:hypothetical protein